MFVHNIVKFETRMWRCGNDGPEIDADDEIQAAVDGVKDQGPVAQNFFSVTINLLQESYSK